MQKDNVRKTKTISKLAVISIITSFLVFLPIISGVCAMVLGAIALYILGLYKDNLKGKIFAVIGITVGAAQVFLFSVLLFVLGFQYLVSIDFDIFLAKLYGKLNKNEEVVRLYKKALLKMPKLEDYSSSAYDAVIYNNLGVAYSLLNKQELAIGVYNIALQESQKLVAQAYYGLAISNHDIGQLEQALVFLDKAIQSNPKFVLAYQEKASILRQLGRFGDSVVTCKETIKLFPTFAQIRSTLGLAYERLDRYEDAVRSHIEAIRLNPRRYFPRDRIYFCLYQINDTAVRSQLLEGLKSADSNFAEEITKRLAKNEAPEADLSKDFEGSLNNDNRMRYDGEITNYSRAVKIPINDMIDFDFKTKEEILELRKQSVLQHPELVNNAYQPSENVFGQIQDNKPWWGVLGFSYYGDGPKSIEGVSWHSRFVLNPYLLVGLTDCYAHRVKDSKVVPQAIYPKPSDLTWFPDSNYAIVTFDITDFWRKQTAMYNNKPSGDILCLASYNARDLGYNYLYVDEGKSKNITSLNQKEKPLEIPFFFHCGESCGYEGGCNNVSPTAPNFRLKVNKIPAMASIKLWRNKPNSLEDKAEMVFLINIK